MHEEDIKIEATVNTNNMRIKLLQLFNNPSK